jgi:hypothetical protein
MESSQISLLNANTLELHYWFNDKTHSMDAVVQNKCEYELLEFIKRLALTFEVEIIIETEPLAEGGIRRWFKIFSKKDKKQITIAVIIGLSAAIFVTPISTALSKAIEIAIEKICEDKGIKELEKEELRLNIELKKQEIEKNNILLKRKSNFYETLDKYPKVEQISIVLENKDKNPVSDEIKIYRSQFKEFVIVSDSLDSIKDETANIEIISPVLKKGDYKWRGIYKGENLSFNMKSIEFKTLVQTGEIEFKNGSSINCLLEIERKIDNKGDETNTEYNIIRVNKYFENDTPMETPEGKKHRQKQEADKRQLKLFD